MAHALDLSLRSYAPQTLSHSHGFHQVVLPLEGALEMEVSGRGGRVAGCQAALIAAGEPHSCEAAGANRFLVLDWAMDEREEDGQPVRLPDIATRDPFILCDPGLQHLVGFLGFELERRRTSGTEFGWGGMLLSALAARIDGAAPAYPRQIARAVAHIRANHHRRLEVEAIARAACCSVSHLHTLFRRYLGQSPMDYMTEVRLDRAMTLLAAGDEPISRIALSTGHADQSVLTRSMKRRRGVTPADYRRRLRSAGGRA
jgi:AraC-like DNA-binding protein